MIKTGFGQRGRNSLRRLISEQLEDRRLLTADPLFHNPYMPVDVDGSGDATARDALIVINGLNAEVSDANGESSRNSPQFFMDVNNDKSLTALDALMIINQLNAEGEGEMARVRVVVTHDDGDNPLMTVGQNDNFTLDILVTDLSGRTENNGVFAAFADITYDDALVSLNGALIAGPEYNPPTGVIDTAGLLDDIGAFDGTTPLGTNEILLLSVPFSPTSNGSVNFEVDPADTSTGVEGNEVLLFGINQPLDFADVLFEGTTITIVDGTSPNAADQSYTTDEEQPIATIFADGLLQGADDPDGDTNLQAVIIEQPSNGTLMDIDPSSGAFVYQPNPDFHGVDSFQFAVSDGTLVSAARTASITVNPVNDSPVGVDDSYEAATGTALNVPVSAGVLANDTDVDSDNLQVDGIDTFPQNGNLQILSNGSFTYTPNAGFLGMDEFVYILSDGSRDAIATVQINVVENSAPIATDDSYSVDEDMTLTVDAAAGVLSNDDDQSGDTLTSTIVDEPTNGSVTLETDGSFVYTPNANFAGTDSFTYQASDANSTSNTATVEITVNGVNDAPVGDVDSYFVDEDGTLDVVAPGVLLNDTDIDSDSLTIVDVDMPSNGQLVHSANGSFTYIPDPDFDGTDTFTYRASDGELESSPITVTINVNAINDAPVAEVDSYSTPSGTQLNVTVANGVLSNDLDVDGDTTTATVVDEPSSGSLQLETDGSFSYTPNAGFTGTDSFTYRANDGTVDSALTTVSVEVTDATNDPEVAISLRATDTNGMPITSTTVGSDFIVEVYVTDVAAPFDGVFAAYLDLLYDEQLVTAGNVIASDEYENDVIGDISMPGVVNELGAFDGSRPKGEGDFLLISVPFTADQAGQLSLATDPADVLPARHVLIFNQDDPVAQADISYGTLTLNINESGGGTDPVARGDSYSTPEGQTLNVTAAAGVLGNDTGDGTLTAQLESQAGDGTVALNSDGSFTYTPNAGFSGTDNFTYRVTDGDGDTSNVATVTINVSDTNQPPVATADSYSVSMDTTLIVNANDGVLQNDSDPDGDSIVANIVDTAANGTVSLNPDGSFIYTPNTNFVGNDTFTYQAVAGDDSSSVTTVTISVFDPSAASSISGNAYVDANSDGVRQSGEVAFVASEVILMGTDFNGNTISRSTITDQTGQYLFENLPAGTYIVRMSQPLFTVDGIDSVDGVQSTMNDRFRIELAAREDATDYNFGERGIHPRFIGNDDFFSSSITDGMIAAVGPDGELSWNCFDNGWSDVRSANVQVNSGGTRATVTVVDVDGTVSTTSISLVGNRNVRVKGSASEGYLVRLIGTRDSFNLVPTGAVDAVFAE